MADANEICRMDTLTLARRIRADVAGGAVPGRVGGAGEPGQPGDPCEGAAPRATDELVHDQVLVCDGWSLAAAAGLRWGSCAGPGW